MYIPFLAPEPLHRFSLKVKSKIHCTTNVLHMQVMTLLLTCWSMGYLNISPFWTLLYPSLGPRAYFIITSGFSDKNWLYLSCLKILNRSGVPTRNESTRTLLYLLTLGHLYIPKETPLYRCIYHHQKKLLSWFFRRWIAFKAGFANYPAPSSGYNPVDRNLSRRKMSQKPHFSVTYFWTCPCQLWSDYYVVTAVGF